MSNLCEHAQLFSRNTGSLKNINKISQSYELYGEIQTQFYHCTVIFIDKTFDDFFFRN